MPTPPPMKICIAGAGIAGLSMAIALRRKGFDVEVFEAASDLTEIGAGIQAYPNVTRILSGWGMQPAMEAVGTPAERTLIRRYADGAVLAELKYDAREMFGFPHWAMHRAVWQKIFFDTAVESGIDVTFDKRIDLVDVEEPAFVFTDGSKTTGDLFIGADGVRSRTRTAILAECGISFSPEQAPQSTYRMLIPGALMQTDPVLASWMREPHNNMWYGPKTAIMGYAIQTAKDGPAYNLVMTRLHPATPGVWNEAGNMADVRRWAAGFEPTMQNLLDRVDGCLKWGLTEIPPLETWRSKNGRVVLCGDAAHAMFPHIGQGASQAIEDAAVLAELLGNAQSTHDLPHLVQAYQHLRKPRAEACVAAARKSMNNWLFDDGPEQEARDKILMALKDQVPSVQERGTDEEEEMKVKAGKDAHPATPAFRDWLYFTDVVAEARKYILSH